MNDGALVVPKKRVPVTLWIHPEGPVQGLMFIHLPDCASGREEQPADVINETADFLVIEREGRDEIRFYNKSSIVRLQYANDLFLAVDEGRPQSCRITMMDGSLIDAEIFKVTPEDRSRLYDCMNDTSERFLKVRPGGSEVMLINKSYVVYISTLEVSEQPAGPVETDDVAPDPAEIEAPELMVAEYQ